MKTKKVWVTRDRHSQIDGVDGDTTIWKTNKKPFMEMQGYFDAPSGEIVHEVSSWQFKNLFGFTPRKGSCKRYNLTLEEIK